MSSNQGHLARDLIGGSLQIHSKLVLDKDANLTVNNVKVDGNKIEFTGAVSADYCPSVVLRFVAESTISPYRVMKVGTTTDFTVAESLHTDANDTGVVGVSLTGAQAGQVVKVCTGGVFSIQIESGTSVTRGDRLVYSTSEDGRATITDSAIGTFGIALESAVADTPGPVIKGVFIRSENY